MPVLAQLLQGSPLREEFWTEERLAERTHVWRQVLPNSLRPGDVVRVRFDAYTDRMSVHNGLVGQVAALRNGVVIAYDGDTYADGTRMGVRHPPEKLERQVPLRRPAQQTTTKKEETK